MAKARVLFARHRKLIVILTGAALTVAVQAWGTNNPWVSLAVLAATAGGVYQVPNQPSGKPATQPATPPARTEGP